MLMRRRDSAAEAIRDELVCCDIYQRLQDISGDETAWRELRRSHDYHVTCFFGEWSARIAERWANGAD